MQGHEKFAVNVTKSPEAIAQARKTIEAVSMNDHATEAAANSEEIIKTLTADWQARGFSPEQCVFALSLATINFRETVPESFGGKDMFDRVAHEAHKYYQANK